MSVYLAEMAPPGRKGLYVGWQSSSQQEALAALLNRQLTPPQLADWGWRVPFLIGCLIVPALFARRRSLRETDEFLRRTHRPDASAIFRSMVAHWALVLTGMMLVAMTTVSFYLITVYTPTFGKNVLELSTTDSLVVTLCAGVSNFIWLALLGALSDRGGRRPPLLAFTLLIIVSAYPARRWLTAAPSFDKMLLVELWLSFLYASYNGAMGVALSEAMPVDVRRSGCALACSLATALFGGFRPAIATGLTGLSGDQAAPGLWMTFAALCGLAATLLLYRQRGVGARPAATAS